MRSSLCALFLSVCLALSACGAGAEVQTDYTGKEAQNKYARAWGLLSFQETEDFYIGSGTYSERAYYYDKVNGISGLLCADPSCAHENSSCCAHVKQGSALFLHGGQRYWITGDHSDGGDHILWRSDLSGENREKLRTISLENIIMAYQPQQYFVHRDHLYFLGKEDVIPIGDRISILGASLDGDEEFTTLFDETYDLYANAEAYFVGNNAYLMVKQFEGTGEVGWDNIYVSINRIDLTTGEQELLYEEADVNAPVNSMWVTEEGKVYFSKNDRFCVLEDGTARELFRFNDPTAFQLWVMDGVVVNSTARDNVNWLEIKDFEGNAIYDGPLFPNGVPGFDIKPGNISNNHEFGYAYVGGDREKLILAMTHMEHADKMNSGFLTSITDYMLSLDLNNNLAPTVLWISEQ